MSHQTTERHIGAISKNAANNLTCDLQNYTAFSFALDEFTDIQDVPQLAIFILYVHPDINVKKEMLDLVTFMKTTCSIHVKNVLDEVMNKFELLRNKLVSVVVDRAPAMIGKNLGLIGLNDAKIPCFLPLHGIIHHEHLTGKYCKYKNVRNIVLQIVNLIKNKC